MFYNQFSMSNFLYNYKYVITYGLKTTSLGDSIFIPNYISVHIYVYDYMNDFGEIRSKF